jgi:uncharacterized membrane protein YgcG
MLIVEIAKCFSCHRSKIRKKPSHTRVVLDIAIFLSLYDSNDAPSYGGGGGYGGGEGYGGGGGSSSYGGGGG